MKIKLKTFLIVWVVLVLLILWGIRCNASLNSRVRLTGGQFGFKSVSLWELHQYKDTTMMRRYPLCYCPYRAYLEVWHHVHIFSGENRNWISVDADLCKLLSDDAIYNRQFAQRFPVHGSRKRKVYLIYKWCSATKYRNGLKYARDVFQTRCGDCAGIASAFYVLCKAKHIPVRYVIGWTRNGCHAWNKVKVSGRWYWIDCTFGYWLQQEQFDGRTVMEMW